MQFEIAREVSDHETRREVENYVAGIQIKLDKKKQQKEGVAARSAQTPSAQAQASSVPRPTTQPRKLSEVKQAMERKRVEEEQIKEKKLAEVEA